MFDLLQLLFYFEAFLFAEKMQGEWTLCIPTINFRKEKIDIWRRNAELEQATPKFLIYIGAFLQVYSIIHVGSIRQALHNK